MEGTFYAYIFVLIIFIFLNTKLWICFEVWHLGSYSTGENYYTMLLTIHSITGSDSTVCKWRRPNIFHFKTALRITLSHEFWTQKFLTRCFSLALLFSCLFLNLQIKWYKTLWGQKVCYVAHVENVVGFYIKSFTPSSYWGKNIKSDRNRGLYARELFMLLLLKSTHVWKISLCKCLENTS